MASSTFVNHSPFQFGHDGVMVTSLFSRSLGAANPPMRCRVQNGINPMALSNREAIFQEVLDALLPHISIEIARDDCRRAACFLLNLAEHIFCTSVAHIRITMSPVPRVHAPMRVEDPENAAGAPVLQLGPGNVARTPFARRTNILVPCAHNVTNLRFGEDSLCTLEFSRCCKASSLLDFPWVITLLGTHHIGPQYIVDVVDDFFTLPWISLERVPPIQVVGRDPYFVVACGRRLWGTIAERASTTQMGQTARCTMSALIIAPSEVGFTPELTWPRCCGGSWGCCGCCGRRCWCGSRGLAKRTSTTQVGHIARCTMSALIIAPSEVGLTPGLTWPRCCGGSRCCGCRCHAERASTTQVGHTARRTMSALIIAPIVITLAPTLALGIRRGRG